MVRLPHRHAEKKPTAPLFGKNWLHVFFPILYLSLSTSIDQSQSRDGPISDESAQESVFHIKIHYINLFASAISSDPFHGFAGRLARVVLVEQIYRAQEIRCHWEGISSELKTYAV